MKKKLVKICMIVLMGLVLLPQLMVVSGAFISNTQLTDYLAPTLYQTEGYSTWGLWQDFTLRYLVELLIDTPEFYVMFWNSAKIAIFTVVGQLVVGVPAAWVFAKFHFRGKSYIFRIYTILLVIPFIVLMLSQYLVFQQLELLDTQWTIILPGIFSAMPVILIYPYLNSIPEVFLEAARVAGYNEMQIFIMIALPLAKPAITASGFLNFIEYWGILEQPLIFLKDKSKWNLSLFISNIDTSNINIAFVSAVISMIPAILLFVFGRDALEEGLSDIALKE